MTRPSKVRGFLDFFGEWDMTLLFVLGPAVGIYLAGTFIAKRRRPSVAADCQAPEKIGARFVIGCVMFGIGWGLVGICPGPSVVALGQGSLPVALFFICMAFGIGITDRLLAKGS